MRISSVVLTLFVTLVWVMGVTARKRRHRLNQRQHQELNPMPGSQTRKKRPRHTRPLIVGRSLRFWRLLDGTIAGSAFS